MQFPLKKTVLLRAGRNILSLSPKLNHFTRIHFFLTPYFFFPYRKQLSAMYKPLTFKNLPFKHVMSLDVCIELPEITRWHILAYFIHISNAWLTGLKSTNVNREQNRGLGVLVLEQKMNHHCWQSLLGQRCLSHGFEWPLLFLVSASLTSTHSPSHEHTPKATPTPFTLEALWNHFWLKGMWIRQKEGVSEATTWSRSMAERLKMSPLALHSQLEF